MDNKKITFFEVYLNALVQFSESYNIKTSNEFFKAITDAMNKEVDCYRLFGPKIGTLCSRYSRGIDFLIRKIFRTLDEYEFENQGTLVDVVNNAHKRGLFEDIEEIRTMKDIRNTIAHEYIEDELVDIFDEVLQYTEKLIAIINTTLNYINKIQ